MAALAAGCGKTGGDKPAAPIDNAKVAARLDKIVAAGKAADGAALAGDNLALDFEWDAPDRHPNAVAVQSDQIADAKSVPADAPKASVGFDDLASGTDVKPEDLAPHPRFTFQDRSHDHILQAKTLLGVAGAKGNGYAYMPEQLVAAKYVLVVTPREVKWAYATVGTFVGGHVKMTAVLVDIDTGKPLGGFEATAESSDKVKTYDKTFSNAQERVDVDLMTQASTAIIDGIKKRWPGAKVPSSF